MGVIIKCEKCKRVYRYSSSEIENIGTVWHPIWVVRCLNCGNQIVWENETIDFFSKSPAAKNRSAYKRAKGSDIREYWIQEYVKDNYSKLGFSKIIGPFEFGPDFKGVYKGEEVLIEVERDCYSYILHKHHKSERFKDVSILIVLNPSKPPKKIVDKLPKTIIYIDINDFVKWWLPKAKAYAINKRIENIINMIAGEFKKRFVRDCDDKDRDMSTCPECDLRPYFGTGEAYEAGLLFWEMALKFIAVYKYSITENFKITDIDPTEIDKFYFDFFGTTEQITDNLKCCSYCKPKVEEGRYFSPDGSSLSFYIDDKGVIHNPNCPKNKKVKHKK